MQHSVPVSSLWKCKWLFYDGMLPGFRIETPSSFSCCTCYNSPPISLHPAAGWYTGECVSLALLGSCLIYRTSNVQIVFYSLVIYDIARNMILKTWLLSCYCFWLDFSGCICCTVCFPASYPPALQDVSER